MSEKNLPKPVGVSMTRSASNLRLCFSSAWPTAEITADFIRTIVPRRSLLLNTSRPEPPPRTKATASYFPSTSLSVRTVWAIFAKVVSSCTNSMLCAAFPAALLNSVRVHEDVAHKRATRGFSLLKRRFLNNKDTSFLPDCAFSLCKFQNCFSSSDTLLSSTLRTDSRSKETPITLSGLTLRFTNP